MRHKFIAVLAVVMTAISGVAGAQTQPTGEWFNEVFDIMFPLPEGQASYVDTYWSCRSGCSRYHWATDIMADKMVRQHAVVDGELCEVGGIDDGAEPSYGWNLTVCGDDGRQYTYIHINNDTPGTDDGAGGLQYAYAPEVLAGGKGMRVTRGQFLAYTGDSGNAEGSGSHLHFEIRDPDITTNNGRYNPYPTLLASQARGDYPETPNPGLAPPPPPPSEPVPEPTTGADGGAEVDRLAGTNRVLTAVALSQASRDHAATVIIAPAGSHPEALVSAALAGLTGAPVLLGGPAGLDQAVIDEVARLGAMNAYVIGDESKLPASVQGQLASAGVVNQARMAASDRYALSAEIARDVASYPARNGQLDEVILALGDAADPSRAWPDALAATALAARAVAPILLVQADMLPEAVAAVLGDFRPSRITVVGGTAAISDAVAGAAAGAAGGAEIRRLAGANRYATSVAVAAAAVEAGLDAPSVWVATGRNFPDALAAGPAAAAAGAPLLLVDGTDLAGSPESSAWLRDNPVGLLVIVGGEAVVSPQVAEATAAAAG